MRPSIAISEMKGTGGEIRIANRVAASLASWSILPDAPGVYAFSARVTNENAWLMAQRPHVLVVPMGSSAWRWRVETLERGDGGVRGTLHGTPERV